MSRQPMIAIIWTLLSVTVTALAQDLVKLPPVDEESSIGTEASLDADQPEQIDTPEVPTLP